ncbi:MAG: UDP-N-acetylmuramoyl-L-alanyl-D-glutamate--2,6-diaminopimelate ligase [Anaerolineaceae bacterium]
MEKKLNQILENVPFEWVTNSSDLSSKVVSVEYDSRQVKNGSIFVALTGQNVDGHRYIKQAVTNGASAIFGSEFKDDWNDLPVPYIQVTETRESLAYISAAFFDYPARSMVMIGVTGTDGKTTTSNLIYKILITAGIKAGMISTVNAQIGDEILDTGFHVTTPEAPAIQYYLRKMCDSGITHVVLETTSHGLAQQRVAGCEFDIGVITNITHEHLDFHGSYESYFSAKAKLFEMLSITKKKPGGNFRVSILNRDDQSFINLNQLIITPKIVYSMNEKADLWAEEIAYQNAGIDFVACSDSFRQKVHCNISGEFNVSNSLAALATTVVVLGISPEIAANGISNLESVPGRMQQIRLGQEFLAIVDFAHTPNALEKALKTSRKMTTGKLIAVFGSAGLRDRQKRRMMASVSARHADITILTAEDPRTENLQEILNEMRSEAEKCGAVFNQNLFVIPDRGEAISKGISLANDLDLVIACGKGHEQSMCFGEIEYPWDDRVAMQSALAKRMKIPGPDMPFLPTQIGR